LSCWRSDPEERRNLAKSETADRNMSGPMRTRREASAIARSPTVDSIPTGFSNG
jgi:hypothetical protein